MIYNMYKSRTRITSVAAESDTRNLQGLGAGEHANTCVQLTCLPFHDGGALHSKHTTALLIVGGRLQMTRLNENALLNYFNTSCTL